MPWFRDRGVHKRTAASSAANQHLLDCNYMLPPGALGQYLITLPTKKCVSESCTSHEHLREIWARFLMWWPEDGSSTRRRNLIQTMSTRARTAGEAYAEYAGVCGFEPFVNHWCHFVVRCVHQNHHVTARRRRMLPNLRATRVLKLIHRNVALVEAH